MPPHPPPQQQALDLDRALHLFRAHGGDAQLHARHLAVLDALSRGAPSVLALPMLCQIAGCALDLLHTRHAPTFLEPACALLRAIGRPCSKQSSADELQLPGVLAGLLRTLARVFDERLPPQLQACAAEVLLDFASVWGNRLPQQPAAAVAADLQSIERAHQTHQSALQESGIVASVCAALKEAVGSRAAHSGAGAGDLVTALTAALLECSSSRELCAQQLRAGVLPMLAELLQAEAASGLQGSLCSVLTELLWNLFEHAGAAASQALQGDDGERGQQPHGIGTAEGLVAALTAVMQHQAGGGASLQVKQQRNDTLTVLCHLSARRPCVPAMVAHAVLLQLLLDAAAGSICASSSGSSSSGLPLSGGAAASKGASNTTSNEGSVEVDHCMLLLAWTTLGNMAAASAPGLEALLSAGLLHLLLSVAEHGCMQSCAGCAVGSSAAVLAWWTRLTAEQLAASQQLAWSLLQQLAPLCKPHFIVCGGISLLLRSLQTVTAGGSSSAGSAWLSTQPALAASFAPTKSKRSPQATGSSSTVEPALRLLRRLVQADADFACSVAAAGAVPVLLQLLQAPAVATLTPVRQGALLVLSGLCAAGGHGCMSALREAGGVGVLLQEVSSVLEGDPYAPSLAALDCLWRCCVSSARSRAQLMAADGMDAVLSLLHRGSAALRPVLLSLLADLLADRRAHNFFWHWYAPVAAGGSGWSSSSSSFSVPRARPPSRGAAPVLSTAGSMASGRLAAQPAAAGSISASSGGEEAWILGVCCAAGQPSASSSSITSTQLLVAIWRQQDKALGVSGTDGAIADASRPLAGTRGASSAHAPRTNHASSVVAAAGGDTAAVGGRAADAYGLLLPARQAVLSRIAQAGTPPSLMLKVFACFAALGVAGAKDSSGVCAEGLRALQSLPAEDAAVLAAIQRYDAFRQGEVWQEIRAQFEEQGVQPTQEDSARLESGIRHAESVAAQVQAAQAALLGVATANKLAVEQLIYSNMAAQHAADARARVYEKDTSKLTMRERLAAKAAREEMLARLKPATLLAEAAVAGGGAREAGLAAADAQYLRHSM